MIAIHNVVPGDDIDEELEGFRGEVFQNRCRVNRCLRSRGHSGMAEVGKDKLAHDRYGDPGGRMERVRCTEVDTATSGTLKEQPPTFASPPTTPLPLLRANGPGPRMVRVASIPSASRRWWGKNVGVP